MPTYLLDKLDVFGLPVDRGSALNFNEKNVHKILTYSSPRKTIIELLLYNLSRDLDLELYADTNLNGVFDSGTDKLLQGAKSAGTRNEAIKFDTSTSSTAQTLGVFFAVVIPYYFSSGVGVYAYDISVAQVERQLPSSFNFTRSNSINSSSNFEYDLPVAGKINGQIYSLNRPSGNITASVYSDSNSNGIFDAQDALIVQKTYNNTNQALSLDLGAGKSFVSFSSSGSALTFTAAGTLTTTNPTTSSTLTLATLKQNPSTSMDAVRDYDGNNLGGARSWKVVGNDVDVQGDGDLETLLFNSEIGRWASVGTVNGFVDFTKNGLNGDTRVVGIYIDPTLINQPQNIGGPFDSQRRFQNDLRINNLSVLAAADYDTNGSQEVYFKVNDGTSVLHGIMHKDGNIQYANYQSKSDLTSFMNANYISSSIWGSWI